MLFVRVKDAPSIVGDTLIVPVVSTGNVGQLAVDLFLSTGWAAPADSPCSLKRVGYLETEHVAPAVGYEVFYPGQPPQLCLNLELHRFDGRPVTLLQQRAPVIAGSEAAFAAELIAWASRSGFKEILLVCGANSPGGLDPAGGGLSSVKWYRAGKRDGKEGSDAAQPTTTKLEEALKATGIGELELRPNQSAPMGGRLADMPGGAAARETFGVDEPELGGHWWEKPAVDENGKEAAPLLPEGMGICRHLCQQPGEPGAPPMVVVLHYCSEGDNMPHAVTMAETINTALGLFPHGSGGGGEGHGEGSPGGTAVSPEAGGVKWSSPLSWSFLYGPPEADPLSAVSN